MRGGHLQQQRFDQQQTAGHQRIALERHRQGEDEFDHQQPAGRDRTDAEQHDGVEDEETDDGRLVPAWRVPEKILRERLGH
ncbi:hypothetical protein D3C78_1696910 [compost metagenome]